MTQEMKLSTQAIGAIMMALQKSLMEQTDIVPVFESFKVRLSDEGLVVINPPLVKFKEDATPHLEEAEENQVSEG